MRWPSLFVVAACAIPACDPVRGEPRGMAPVHEQKVVAAIAPAAPSIASPSATAMLPREAPTIEPARVDGPPTVERIDVVGHLPISIVAARDGKPPRIVFFPGICSNAGAYLYGFAQTARDRGGAIAIDGDRPCGASKDFRSITSDPTHEEPRIAAALAAAGIAEESAPDIVWMGYSLGATLIENLAKKSPDRYRKIVLIGSPRDPRRDRLGGASVVATMSCSLDVPGRMKGAVAMLEAAGVAARYFEMPGCTHGNLAEGDRVFGAALDFVSAHDR